MWDIDCVLWHRTGAIHAGPALLRENEKSTAYFVVGFKTIKDTVWSRETSTELGTGFNVQLPVPVGGLPVDLNVEAVLFGSVAAVSAAHSNSVRSTSSQ